MFEWGYYVKVYNMVYVDKCLLSYLNAHSKLKGHLIHIINSE